MKLITYPNPILTKKCFAVTMFDDSLKTIVKEMLSDCQNFHGYALAAPQVGLSQSFFVSVLPDFPEFIANPVIRNPIGSVRHKEACLSIPDIWAWTERYAEFDLEYQDINGNHQKTHLVELAAIMCQHEIDHLNGELFVDKLSSFEKNKIIGKLNKMRLKKSS